MDQSLGRPFHGEFSSANASSLTEAQERFTLYSAGSNNSITLASTDMVVITDVFIYAAASMKVTVFDGSGANPSAGNYILQGTLAANTVAFPSLNTPHYCAVGTYPHVQTSTSGQIDVYIHGIIIRNGQ
jgi:hypothetical protein